MRQIYFPQNLISINCVSWKIDRFWEKSLLSCVHNLNHLFHGEILIFWWRSFEKRFLRLLWIYDFIFCELRSLFDCVLDSISSCLQRLFLKHHRLVVESPELSCGFSISCGVFGTMVKTLYVSLQRLFVQSSDFWVQFAFVLSLLLPPIVAPIGPLTSRMDMWAW